MTAREYEQILLVSFVIDRPPITINWSEHLYWLQHVVLVACHLWVASRLWAFGKSFGVFSECVVCPGEATHADRWNHQSHGRWAFGVWEDTSGFQGKGWCLATATGCKRLDFPWKALEYQYSQDPYDGSHLIVHQIFRTDSRLHYGNGLYSYHLSRWCLLLIFWWRDRANCSTNTLKVHMQTATKVPIKISK